MKYYSTGLGLEWSKWGRQGTLQNVRGIHSQGHGSASCLCRGQARFHFAPRPLLCLTIVPALLPSRNRRGCSISTPLQHRWLSKCLLRKVLKKLGRKRVHVACFHLYIILENENKSIHSDRKTISSFLGKEGVGRRNYKGHKRNIWGMDMVIILTMVMNSQVYTYVKADQIMHFLTCVVYCMSVVHQWSYFSKSNLEWDNTLRFYLYIFKPLVKAGSQAFLFLHHLEDLCWQRRNKKETAWKPMTS